MVVLCAVPVVALAAAAARADTLLVDRGLPTANLNTGDSSQSNVNWGDPDSSVMMGDDFTLPPAAGSYGVTDIRVWLVNGYFGSWPPPTPLNPPSFAQMFNGVSLELKGPSGGFSVVSSTPIVTPVTYSDGSAYEGYAGLYSQIYQLDFAVNLTAAAGSKYYFAINASANVDLNNEYGVGLDYIPFLSASNAALSGSPQQGSDGLVYGWGKTTGALDYTLETGAPGGGWDKDSDFNVQVFGAAVPEPVGIVALLGLGGMGLIGLVWRRRKPA
jgi:hypothetical protein